MPDDRDFREIGWAFDNGDTMGNECNSNDILSAGERKAEWTPRKYPLYLAF